MKNKIPMSAIDHPLYLQYADSLEHLCQESPECSCANGEATGSKQSQGEVEVELLKSSDLTFVARLSWPDTATMIVKITAGPLVREEQVYRHIGRCEYIPNLLASSQVDDAALLLLEDVPGEVLRDVKTDREARILQVLTGLIWFQSNKKEMSNAKSVLNERWDDRAAKIIQRLDEQFSNINRDILERALTASTGLPVTRKSFLCHGDLFADAVICDNARVCLLDWGFACAGPALLDRSTLLQNNSRKNGFDDWPMEKRIRLYQQAHQQAGIMLTPEEAAIQLSCGWFISDLFFLDWVLFRISNRSWNSGRQGVMQFIDKACESAYLFLMSKD